MELIFAGLPTSDEDGAAQVDNLPTIAQRSSKKDEPEFDRTDYVLKRNSVFKCRICPRIVCLSEETLKAHLSSKASIILALLHSLYISDQLEGLFFRISS